MTKSLRESAKEVLWRQWQSCGARISSPRKAGAIVDPEALLLLSLALRERERRLWDVIAWWGATCSSLLSIQRIKNLAGQYPESVGARLGEFALLALHQGGDFRWRSLAGSRPGPKPRGQKNHKAEPALIEPAALVLRLRRGIGVGIKADVLSFLLGIRGAWASVSDIAAATGYSTRAARRAAEEMAEARLIRTKAGTPVQYHVVQDLWVSILELREPTPQWRFWQPAFAFIAHFLEWTETGALEGESYMTSSRARDLFELHRSAFSLNQIVVPDPKDHRGIDYLEAFKDTVVRLADWLERSA